MRLEGAGSAGGHATAARALVQSAMQAPVDGFSEAVMAKSKLCLLYGAKDETHNQAVVLRELILEELGQKKG